MGVRVDKIVSRRYARIRLWEPEVQPGGLNITLCQGEQVLLAVSMRTASAKKAHDAIREARARRDINACESRRLHDKVSEFFAARSEDASTSLDNVLVGNFEPASRVGRTARLKRILERALAARAQMGLPARSLPGEELISRG